MLSAKHLKFCEAVAAGTHPGQAFADMMGRGRDKSGDVSASRLLKKATVQTEIGRIRAEAEKLAGSGVMTVLEKRLLLAQICRTPLAQINENSVLCQELVRTKKKADKDAGGEEQLEFWETERIKKPCLIATMRLDSDLADDFSEKKRNDAAAAALGGAEQTMAELRQRRESA